LLLELAMHEAAGRLAEHERRSDRDDSDDM
jgi:hypothetical protein